jgi:hypothetical protein
MNRLKRGAIFFTSTQPGETSNEFFCGTPKKSLRIASPEAREQLQLLAGAEFTSAVVATSTVVELAELGLLDSSEGKLKLTKRYDADATSGDAAFQQLRTRVAAELSQTTWIEGVTDTGIAVLSARQNFLIEISGANRIATLLYSILLASGVAQARYSTQPSTRISDLDIGLSGIAPKDIGALRAKERESHRQDLSLFPIEKEINYLDELSTPDLIIQCGEIDPTKYAQWMADGQPFLYIPNPMADVAEIGPLVIPGKSPCIRCSQLARPGLIDHRPFTAQQLSTYPIIAAHYVAALAAAMAISFCDGITLQRDFSATGKVIVCDYQSLSAPQEILIALHPRCGCTFN